MSIPIVSPTLGRNIYTYYQTQVIGRAQIIPYDQIVMECYREAIKHEPMIGIKVLLRDPLALEIDPRQRIAFINQGLKKVLSETDSGCCLRETGLQPMPDGFWLISFPVPRSQFSFQLTNVINTINLFNNFLGFTCTGMVEISISGAVDEVELMRRLKNVVIPEKYLKQLVKPDTDGLIAYNFGCMIPINNRYTLIKTRWNIDSISMQYDGLRDTVERVAFIISNVFH